MRWFAIGLLLTLISPVYGSDFVTKVMKTDLELQMAEDGFSERDIENIKIIAMGITVRFASFRRRAYLNVQTSPHSPSRASNAELA